MSIRTGECVVCGAPVTSGERGPIPRTCSASCTAKTPKGRIWRRRQNRRKDLKRRATIVEAEVFDNEEIFERDGYTCHICGEPCPRDAHYNDEDAPTLDHLIPVRPGAIHTRENVATAHRRCNRDRAARERVRT